MSLKGIQENSKGPVLKIESDYQVRSTNRFFFFSPWLCSDNHQLPVSATGIFPAFISDESKIKHDREAIWLGHILCE